VEVIIMPENVLESLKPYIPFLVIFISAIMVALVIIAFFWYKDKYEREPVSLIIAMFVWGVIAAIISMFIEGSIVGAVDHFTFNVILAPFVEELLIVIGLILMSRHKEYEGVMDGMVYGISVGAGFVFLQNLTYGLSLLGTVSLLEAVSAIFLQSVLVPIAHPFFAAWFGAEIGRIKLPKKKEPVPINPVVTIIIAFITVFLFHGLWNLAGIYSPTELFHATVNSIIVLILFICLFYSKFKEARILEWIYRGK